MSLVKSTLYIEWVVLGRNLLTVVQTDSYSRDMFDPWRVDEHLCLWSIFVFIRKILILKGWLGLWNDAVGKFVCIFVFRMGQPLRTHILFNQSSPAALNLPQPGDLLARSIVIYDVVRAQCKNLGVAYKTFNCG